MIYARPDLGARLSASPSLAPIYAPFVHTLETKVEECQCGECVQALDAAPEVFGAALLALAGPRLTEHEDQCADFIGQYLPHDIGEIGCATGSC